MTTPENVSQHGPFADATGKTTERANNRRGWILTGLWVALAPVAVYAPKGTVVVLILFLLAIPDHRSAARETWSVARSPLGLATGIFLLFAALSASWALNPQEALIAAARLLVMTVMGLMVFVALAGMGPDAARRMGHGLVGCVVLTMALLGLEYLTGGSLGSLFKGSDQSNLIFTSRGSSTLAVLSLPAATLLWRRPHGKPFAVGLLMTAAAVIIPLPMLASLIAVGLGLIVCVLTWWIGARGFYAMVIVAGVFTFASPWIFKDVVTLRTFGDKVVDVPISWQHRLGIWTFVGERALQRPFLGHGFDSSRVIGREPGMVSITTTERTWEQKQLPLHPHSLALQLWLELGAIGIVAMMTIFGLLARLIVTRTSDRSVLAALVAGLVAVWVFMSVSFGAWQNSWLAVIWLCAAAYAIALPRKT